MMLEALRHEADETHTQRHGRGLFTSPSAPPPSRSYHTNQHKRKNFSPPPSRCFVVVSETLATHDMCSRGISRACDGVVG
jgi:hypothetical protein